MQRNFGPVMQIAWVVRDLEAAIDHWTRMMNVGPFFLFEHVQAGAFLRLLLHGRIQLLRNASELDLNLAEPRLALLDRASARQHMLLFNFDIGGELVQTGLQPRAFLLQLNFLR